MKKLFSKRPRHLFIVKKSVFAAIMVMVVVAGIFAAVSVPAIKETSVATRQLPIYSVECEGKRCSLSFDAAWGDMRVRQLYHKGLRVVVTFNA